MMEPDSKTVEESALDQEEKFDNESEMHDDEDDFHEITISMPNEESDSSSIQKSFAGSVLERSSTRTWAFSSFSSSTTKKMAGPWFCEQCSYTNADASNRTCALCGVTRIVTMPLQSPSPKSPPLQVPLGDSSLSPGMFSSSRRSLSSVATADTVKTSNLRPIPEAVKKPSVDGVDMTDKLRAFVSPELNEELEKQDSDGVLPPIEPNSSMLSSRDLATTHLVVSSSQSAEAKNNTVSRDIEQGPRVKELGSKENQCRYSKRAFLVWLLPLLFFVGGGTATLVLLLQNENASDSTPTPPIGSANTTSPTPSPTDDVEVTPSPPPIGSTPSLTPSMTPSASATQSPSAGITFVPTEAPKLSFIPLGQEGIKGESPNRERFGTAVSLSKNGTFVAVGAPNFRAPGSNQATGRVQVYQYEQDSWEQFGQDLWVEYDSRSFGSLVSLSDDGMTVAISGKKPNDNDNFVGIVAVYSFDTNGQQWFQLGDDIDPPDRKLVSNLTLSGDGSVVTLAVEVRVVAYEFDNQSWTKKGQTIKAQTGSITSDGKFLVIGNSSSGYSRTGFAQVYEYDADNWVSRGQPIRASDDVFGDGNSTGPPLVAISDDANFVAISTLSTGKNAFRQVQVFEYDDNGMWTLIGEPIRGKESSNPSVELSSDGQIVVLSGSNFPLLFGYDNGWESLAETSNQTLAGNTFSLADNAIAIGNSDFNDGQGEVNVFKIQ